MTKQEKQDLLMQLSYEYNGDRIDLAHAGIVGMAFAILDESQIDKMISYLKQWIEAAK